MEIIKTDKIDKELFNIEERDNHIPPIAVSINSVYYQISGFADKNNEYIYYGEKNIREAIEEVCKYIYSKSFIIYAKLALICNKFNIPIDSISIFQEKGLKGKKTEEILLNSLNLPRELLYYIDKKDVSVKLTGIILSQHKHIINFIKGYVIDNEPSIQSFRIFVEKTADFKDIIPNEYNKDFIFPDRRSILHKEMNNCYNEVIKAFSPLKIINNDSFESPKLSISYDIYSMEDYNKVLNILSTKKEVINRLYKKMLDLKLK